MFFLFITLSSQIMEYTKNLTIGKINENDINNRKIKSNLFTYSSTGDRDGYPISNVFSEENTYWIAKDSSIGNSKSAIFIYFKKTISLERFLIYTAYTTKKGGTREFSGYPLKVNVYSSVNNNILKLHSIFSGTQPTHESWGKGAQFTFNEPLLCDKLKIEFEKVSLDKFFNTNDETAIVGKLYFVGSVVADNLQLEKVRGVYADNNFVNSYKIPSTSFTYESNGDKAGKPISNAFDDNPKTYWVAESETTDSFHSSVTVTFNTQVTLDAILFDAAYRTKNSLRTFDGFPIVLKIYSSLNNEQLTLNTIFSGNPSGTDWSRTQFVFKTPISVKKLKIEFADVTPDGSFSNFKKVAATGGFTFINGKNQKIKYSKPNNTFTNSYISSHRIPTQYFTYNTTGDRNGNPISYAFDYKNTAGEYWVAKDINTDFFHSSIFVNFTRPVSLSTLLFDHAYSTTNNDRYFHGFPTKLNVHTSLGNEQLSLKCIFEGDAPTLKSFGGRSQFSFKTPILCDRLQIEFVEVTHDNHFTNSTRAVVHELILIGDVLPDSLTLTGVFGSYDDSSFMKEYMIHKSMFSYSSTGDKSGHPLSNAFDEKSDTYWVSNNENTNDFKNSITVDFYNQQTLGAILFDPGFRSRKDSNKKDIRYFDGFPTTFTIYISIDNSNNFIPEAIFTGEPVFPWKRIQFVFKKPVKCKKIKLEFTNITFDDSFSKKNCAVTGGIYLIKESYKLPTIPAIDGIIEVPQNKCNTHFRCDVNVTTNNVITIDLRQSSFNNFNSNNNGGAISLINCGALFEESTFNECTSSKGGGAIFFQNNLQRENNFELININFVNCTAVYGGCAYIYSIVAHVKIIKCTFRDAKLEKSSELFGDFIGGSALFLTVKNGYYEKLSFKSCDMVVVKFYNKFENKPSSMILSHLDNKMTNIVLFSHCTFEFNNPTDSLIYYVNGDNDDSIIKVSDCEFIGENKRKISIFDGKAIDNNSPRLIVELCKFSSSSIEALKSINSKILSFKLNNQILSDNYSKTKELNSSWKSIAFEITALAFTLIIGVLFIKNLKLENDGRNNAPFEINQN